MVLHLPDNNCYQNAQDFATINYVAGTTHKIQQGMINSKSQTVIQLIT